MHDDGTYGEVLFPAFFGISGSVSVEACDAQAEVRCTYKRTGAVSLAVGELAQMP
jgi:hypothetical protein